MVCIVYEVLGQFLIAELFKDTEMKKIREYCVRSFAKYIPCVMIWTNSM